MEQEGIGQPKQMRKLFIGGLHRKTTDESLKAYFEQFGEVVFVDVKRDPKTKKSRRFGFVVFSRSHMVDETQNHRPHKIDGTAVFTRRAGQTDKIWKSKADLTDKKVYVGGLEKDVDEEDLREEFSQFGLVVDVTIPTEKDSQIKRGFAFVEFEDYDAVDKAFAKKDITVKNKRVQIKKGLSKKEAMKIRQYNGGMNRNSSASGVVEGSWGGKSDNSWSNNQNSRGWRDNRGGKGNRGNYGRPGGSAGPGGYNQDGYNNSGHWRGEPNQGCGGNQNNEEWGSNPANYGGPGNSWKQGQKDFGNNYYQSYGGRGGPMRSQYYGHANRSTPYNTGTPMGYYNPGGGGGSSYGMGSSGPDKPY